MNRLFGNEVPTSDSQKTTPLSGKVHVWEYLGKQGFGNIYLLIHPLNAKKMKEIYQNCLLIDGFFKRKHGDGINDGVVRTFTKYECDWKRVG